METPGLWRLVDLDWTSAISLRHPLAWVRKPCHVSMGQHSLKEVSLEKEQLW
jgi:hypothetical protein